MLHDKCVALAQEKGVEPEVRSCAADSAGTRVCRDGDGGGVTGVTRRESPCDGIAAITIVGAALPSLSLEKRAVLALDAAGIALRGVDAGERSLTLTVGREQSREALCAIHDAVV